MKILIPYLFLVTGMLLVTSCTDWDIYEGRYIIENETDKRVELKFYSHENDSDPILVLTKSIDGRGVLFDESKTLDDPLDRETPERIYGADSIAMIFEIERIQAHYGFIPSYNSLTFFGDYESEGNTKRYIITDENFENATPCDEACN